MNAIANLWATKIIDGDKTFSQVPAKLKEQVKNALIDKGAEELVVE